MKSQPDYCNVSDLPKTFGSIIGSSKAVEEGLRRHKSLLEKKCMVNRGNIGFLQSFPVEFFASTYGVDAGKVQSFFSSKWDGQMPDKTHALLADYIDFVRHASSSNGRDPKYKAILRDLIQSVSNQNLLLSTEKFDKFKRKASSETVRAKPAVTAKPKAVKKRRGRKPIQKWFLEDEVTSYDFSSKGLDDSEYITKTVKGVTYCSGSAVNEYIRLFEGSGDVRVKKKNGYHQILALDDNGKAIMPKKKIKSAASSDPEATDDEWEDRLTPVDNETGSSVDLDEIIDPVGMYLVSIDPRLLKRKEELDCAKGMDLSRRHLINLLFRFDCVFDYGSRKKGRLEKPEDELKKMEILEKKLRSEFRN